MQEKRQGYQTVLFEHTRLTLTCSNLYTSARLSIAEKSWEAWEHNANEQHTPAIRIGRCIAPSADYVDEQHTPDTRIGRCIAPSADYATSTSVGADLSRPAPIYRPSLEVPLSA